MQEVITFKGEELFLIPTRSRNTLLYAPLFRKLFLISDNLARIINQDGFNSAHEKVNYLKESLLDGLKRKIKPELPVGNSYFHLSLELTRDCTLNCVYCHSEAGRKESMSPELLETAVDYAFKTSVERNCKRVIASFVAGGEPTANWPLFTNSIKAIKETSLKYNQPIRLSITTNGYFKEPKRKYLLKNFDNINLSLDGPEDIQNRQRPTSQGKGSFTKVVATGIYFAHQEKPFTVRATVTSYSVNRMEEIVCFFQSIFGNKADVVFEPCFPVGRAKIGKMVLLPSQELFLQNYFAAKEKGAELGINVTCSAENTDKIISTYCSALARPSFVVTTKGTVTACEGDAEGQLYPYGRFKEKAFIRDDGGIDKIAKLTTILPEKCNSCFAKYHCAGDCPTTRTSGQDLCVIKKGITLYNLERIIS
ncbi:radical SAM protein [Candidatus Woesearchaeota archaeon]|nr:radical SAM protein [Candidatus Woesearchaeota archaeon]